MHAFVDNEGVACAGVLQARYDADLARREGVDFDGVVGIHFEKAGSSLGDVEGGVVEDSAAVKGT